MSEWLPGMDAELVAERDRRIAQREQWQGEIDSPRPLKVLICGSRDWKDVDAVTDRVAQLPHDAIVIEGEADGADAAACVAAEHRGLFVAAVAVKGPHWRKYGRSAGHKRNAAMLALGPDLVVAFQRNGSRGTQGTIDRARELGIEVEVHAA